MAVARPGGGWPQMGLRRMSSPPYYILVSHSSLGNTVSGALSASLTHPEIQYHYADDSPLALLPKPGNEQVIVLDYDPLSPSARSLSESLTVTGLRVAAAPGTTADDDSGRNDRMYILETISAHGDKTVTESQQQTPEATVALFKQRNVILQSAIQYPERMEPQILSPTSLPATPRQA